MKFVVLYVVVSILALVGALALSFSVPQPEYRVINCGVAEISPDFTTEMREACRRARMEKIK
jgi:capsular polysaccharide biosynthesis protein